MASALPAARWRGVPVVYDAHTMLESELPSYAPSALRGLTRVLGRWLDGVVPAADYALFQNAGRAPVMAVETLPFLVRVTEDGLPLRKPFDDLNADGKQGAQRARDVPVPAAGQVRLGTDPAAGPVLPYGIPVLGASIEAYDPAPTTTEVGNVVVGATVVLTASLDHPNFLAYRLPAITDYEKLPYTPRGMDPLATRETFRFFSVRRPAAALLPDGSPLGARLPSAGLYGGAFRQDSWSRQVARYRHMFHLPAAALPAG